MEKSNNSRISWIDNSRAIAICCVIFCHNSNMLEWGNDAVMPIVHSYVALFIMPLFVFISGYCGFNSIDRICSLSDYYSYAKKLFKRVYLPCLVWGGFLSFVVGSSFFIPHLKGLLGGYWFLAMLFSLSVIIAFIHYLSKIVIKKTRFCSSSHLRFISFLILSFCSVILLSPVRIGEMAPFFLMGLIFKKYDLVERMSRKPYIVFCLILSTIVFAFVYATGFLQTTLRTFYVYNFLHFLRLGLLHFWLLRVMLSCSIILTIVLFLSFTKYHYNFFSSIGANTLPLYVLSMIPWYLWHEDCVGGYIKSCSFYNNLCSSLVFVYLANIIISLSIFIICWFLIKLFRRNKWTSLFLLGE